MATENGFHKEASQIYKALVVARPESEIPLIGYAVVTMNLGCHKEAISILEDKALKLNPKSDLAKSFLGLAYRLDGNNEKSKSLLESVVKSGSDEGAKHMAETLLSNAGESKAESPLSAKP